MRPRPTPPSPSAPLALGSWAVGLAALVVYLGLTPSVPGGKDGAEFALVLATNGLAHPTGYPLHTLLGGAFVRALHAMGADWSWAANAWSALGGAVAVGALHALTVRLLATRGNVAHAGAIALLPAGAFALNAVWTTETTLAEVNSWHVAWVMGAALVALGAGRAFMVRDTPNARVHAWTLAWGVTLGAGAAHHTSAVLYAVPLTVTLLVLAQRAGRSLPGFVGLALLGAMLPLSSLSHVFAHAARPDAVAQWPALEPGLRGVLDHLTGAQYRGFLGRFAPHPFQLQLLVREILPWLVPGVLAALALLRQRGDAVRAALAVATLAQVAWAFAYGVPDPAPYFLPPLATGLALLTVVLTEGATVRRHARTVFAVASALVVVAAVHGMRIAEARRDSVEAFDARVVGMWNAIPDTTGFVVWDDDMAYRLRVLQSLGGSHPRLSIVQPRMLTYRPERARFVARHGFDPVADLAVPAAGSDETRSR
ncbi:MAG: hypothetical protein RL721_2239, partial [Candidatus Eisenbacteria bacterium]